ncbi:hypothetical protein R2601_04233 [Salipiger bermudensis HTCC2601]|uniref:Uncharacterized protein n=1 Tax=Salipiger bermudensis (strain DSM 26914 / JCM 13377 / KCTC 12554 / HTCC2601) TaxID=314265 RepID=Q0FVZ9_SALBH|nr:hypothetical protein R2601_04233 [Salipiger bermudensis HTCC2601]
MPKPPQIACGCQPSLSTAGEPHLPIRT